MLNLVKVDIRRPAVVADSEAELQDRLEERKEVAGRHGLRVRKKMEVFWVGQQNKDLDIRLDGKKLNQRDSFVYLGGGFAGTATRRRKFAGQYKLGRVRGGKWKG